MCDLGTQDHKRPKTEDKRPPRKPLVHFKDGKREALTGCPKPHKVRCKTGWCPAVPAPGSPDLLCKVCKRSQHGTASVETAAGPGASSPFPPLSLWGDTAQLGQVQDATIEQRTQDRRILIQRRREGKEHIMLEGKGALGKAPAKVGVYSLGGGRAATAEELWKDH